jgi:hypothetical protein
MSKYLSDGPAWLDPSIDVLKNSSGKGVAIEALHGREIILLKNGKAVDTVRSISIEKGTGNWNGYLAMQISAIGAAEYKAEDRLEMVKHSLYLKEAALPKLEPNSYAPGSSDLQIDISDDED